MRGKWAFAIIGFMLIAVSAFALQNREIRESVTDAVSAAVTPEEPMAVPEGTLITVQLENEVSTSDSRVGDGVWAVVVEPISVDGKLAIPEGARVSGEVIVAEPPGRVKGRGHLQFRYDVLAVGEDRYAIGSRSVMYESPSSARRDAALIGGGAVAGGIVGGATGGSAGSAVKGAVIGGALGTATSLATLGPQLVFRPGALLRFRLDRELLVRREPA